MCGIFAAIIKHEKIPSLDVKNLDFFGQLNARGPDVNFYRIYEFNSESSLILAGWTLNLRSETPTLMPTDEGLVLGEAFLIEF